MIEPGSPNFAPLSPEKRYLKPSVFWSIRQGVPRRLALTLSALALLVPLLLWAAISYAGLVPPLFLPTPTAVLQAGLTMLTENSLLPDIFVSSIRVAGGFLLAALVGIPIGWAMGTFHSMESLFAPIVGTVRYMPVPAFVPLIILWVGLGEASKILVVFLGVVFYNAMMVADAVKFIPNEMLHAAYTLGATRKEVFFKVILPATFPSVLDTLRINMSGAWTFLVIAELIAAQSGLGFRILQSQRFLQTDKVLFCIAVIGIIGLITDCGLKWISAKLTPWSDQVHD